MSPQRSTPRPRGNRLRLAGSALALGLLVPAVAAVPTGLDPAATAADAAPAHFVVLGPTGDGLRGTEDSVRAVGGSVVQSWPQIGVLLATSPDPGFAAAVRAQPAVDQAGASRNLAEQLPPAPPSTRLEPLEGTAEQLSLIHI